MRARRPRSQVRNDAALQAIDRLMGAAQGTPEADALEILVTLVEAYEARCWPIGAPDPVSMIEHVMEARGLRSTNSRASHSNAGGSIPMPTWRSSPQIML